MGVEKKGAVASMLLEFSCANHKSIKNQVIFSAIAGKDSVDEHLMYHNGHTRILKTGVIYGANGSGKSNLIDAINFTRWLVLNSVSNQPGQGVPHYPHKLSASDDESTYSLQFIRNGIRYAFGFAIRQSLIVDEYLYYFPKTRQTKIYERAEEGFQAGDKFKGKFDTVKDVLKPNRLFLSCAANFSAVPEIEEVFAFFRDDLVIYRGFGFDNWMNYSLHVMKESPEVKNLALEFLDNLGTGIKDIQIKIDKKSMESVEFPAFLSDNFKAQLMKRTEQITAKVIYKDFAIDLLTEESTGIRKLFEFICPLIDIMSKGKVLICDELENNIHEAAVYAIVDWFKHAETPAFAQMFFTAHDTSLLNLELFRRDQIWFTEMERESRSTQLYSLAEIKNVRKDENIGKGYISGKYGAIPMLNQTLIHSFDNIVR